MTFTLIRIFKEKICCLMRGGTSSGNVGFVDLESFERVKEVVDNLEMLER